MMQIVRRKSFTLICCAIALTGCASATYWWTGRPTEKNIELEARRVVEERMHGTGELDMIRTPPGAACISAPLSPQPDRYGNDGRGGEWFMDFYPQSADKKGRTEQLRKLDAMVAAGLLERAEMKLVEGDIQQPVIRYLRSDAGFAASTGGGNGGRGCFIYGVPKMLSVKQFVPIKVGGVLEGSEIYEVTVKMGFPGNEGLARWALHPELLKEFPDVAKTINDGEMKLALARVKGRLENFDKVYQAMQTERQQGLLAAQLESASLWQRAQVYWEHGLQKVKATTGIGAGFEPTEEEIRSMLTNDQFMNGQNCFRLVDNNYYRVDKLLDTSNYSRFALDLDRDRMKYDLVGQYTIPYVLALEQLGVYQRDGVEVLQGRPGGTVREAVVFVFNKNFAPAFQLGCIPLGSVKVEVLDLKIRHRDPQGYVSTRFSYTAKISPVQPPAWATDPSLRAQWPELEYALQRGYICQGEFGFDREMRSKTSGSGGCYPNYPRRYQLAPNDVSKN